LNRLAFPESRTDMSVGQDSLLSGLDFIPSVHSSAIDSLSEHSVIEVRECVDRCDGHAPQRK
jgi:hypothetical protein